MVGTGASWWVGADGRAGGLKGRSTRSSAPDVPAGGSANLIAPLWRVATQRAMARPSPVPPVAAPSTGSASVPNRSNARSRSAGATPGPSSATSSRHRSGVTSQVTRTRPPSGLCLTALSSTLVSSWRSRAGSACTSSASGMSTSNRTARPVGTRSATTSSTRAPTRTGPSRSGATPASTRESSSRSPTRAPIRWAWSTARPRCSASAGRTPSARFSRVAVSAASGVRSSWETVATRLRCSLSTLASSAAIWLNARASSPISSEESARTRPR